MAASEAVEEMRDRVVLGEFGVRNVRACRGKVETGTGLVGVGIRMRMGLGRTALCWRGSCLCPRFIPRTFLVTIRVTTMPGTRTASRRWVGPDRVM